MESFNFFYNNLMFCIEKFLFEIFISFFYGFMSSCFIVVDLVFFKSSCLVIGVFKVVLVVMFFVMFLFMVVLVFVVFGYKSKVKISEVKDVLVKEE